VLLGVDCGYGLQHGVVDLLVGRPWKQFVGIQGTERRNRYCYFLLHVFSTVYVGSLGSVVGITLGMNMHVGIEHGVKVGWWQLGPVSVSWQDADVGTGVLWRLLW